MVNVIDLPRSLDRIIDRVREIAAATPDFVYTLPRPDAHPLYVVREGGALCGSCIFGRALIDLGVDPDRLLALQEEMEDATVRKLLRKLGIIARYQDSRLRWCDDVQFWHDHEKPLHTAIARADAAWPEVAAA